MSCLSHCMLYWTYPKGGQFVGQFVRWKRNIMAIICGEGSSTSLPYGDGSSDSMEWEHFCGKQKK